MILALKMRACENLAPAGAAHTNHVADAIDLCIEPSLGHALDQPLPRGNVLGRERRPVHAGFVRTERAKLVQVSQNAFGLDRRHGNTSH
jgi:hypothetical protein